MKTSIHSSTFALLLTLTGRIRDLAAHGGCKPTTTTDSPGQFVDDSVINNQGEERPLGRTTRVKSFEIKVETVKGVVQLSGSVD